MYYIISSYKAYGIRHKAYGKPGATRFATVHIGLKSLGRNAQASRRPFMDTTVIAYVEKNKNQRSTPGGPTLMELYLEAKEIAGMLEFWTNLTKVCKQTPHSKCLFSFY